MTDKSKRDPCTPESRLSYASRAVLFYLWSHEHASTWAMNGETGEVDEFLKTEADKLCANWDAYLAKHGRPAFRFDVSRLYNRPEAEEALAKWRGDNQ